MDEPPHSSHDRGRHRRFTGALIADAAILTAAVIYGVVTGATVTVGIVAALTVAIGVLVAVRWYETCR